METGEAGDTAGARDCLDIMAERLRAAGAESVGSVSRQVIRHARGPVLMVPAQP